MVRVFPAVALVLPPGLRAQETPGVEARVAVRLDGRSLACWDPDTDRWTAGAGRALTAGDRPATLFGS